MTTTPGEIWWNADKHRFEWSVQTPGGYWIGGHAATEQQARHDISTDWRVRGEQPRLVTRTRRGGIAPRP